MRGGIAAAALRPLNLAVLAAGGLVGALVHWPYAGAGLLAYAAAVAISSRGPHRKPLGGDALSAPEPRSPAVRSTEVMAHVVRIRKGHGAFRAVLLSSPPGVRELFGDSFGRMGDVVQHSYGLAVKADELRAHLDRSPTLPVLEREAAAAMGEAANEARERVENRRALEAEYARLGRQLAQVGGLLENWHGRVLNASTRAPATAQEESRELGEALAHMDVEVRVLADSVKV